MPNWLFRQLDACADHLHELIGDHGDEQMSFGPNRLVVIDRSQTEFRFQWAEHRFEVGEGAVGAPQGGFVPVGFAAAQAIHPRMGHHRAGERAAGEAHGRGALSRFISAELDVIVLSDAAAVFPEPADALPGLVDAFMGPRFGESLGELGECALEAFGEALDEAAFLVGALFGEAVQAHLPGIVGHSLCSCTP